MKKQSWALSLMVAMPMLAASVNYVDKPFAAQNFGGRIRNASDKPVDAKVQEIACSDFRNENPKVLGTVDTGPTGGFQFAYTKGIHCLRIQAAGFRTTVVKVDVTNNTAERAAFIHLVADK